MEQTANKLATAIDKTAEYFRNLSSGTVQTPDYSDVSGVVTEFQEACKSSLPRDTAESAQQQQHAGQPIQTVDGSVRAEAVTGV